MHPLSIILQDQQQTIEAQQQLSLSYTNYEAFLTIKHIRSILSKTSIDSKLAGFLESDTLLKSLKTTYQSSDIGVEFLDIIIKKLTGRALKALLPKHKSLLLDNPALQNARVDLYIKEMIKLFETAADKIPAYSKSSDDTITTLPYSYFLTVVITSINFTEYLLTLNPLTDKTAIDKYLTEIEAKFNSIFKAKKVFILENKQIKAVRVEEQTTPLKDSAWVNASKLKDMKTKMLQLYRLTVILTDRLQQLYEKALVMYKQVEDNALPEKEQTKVVEELNRLQAYGSIANTSIMMSKRYINLVVHSVLGPILDKAEPNNTIIRYRY